MSERLEDMPLTETLLSQFCKELIRKMDKLEQLDLPEEALCIIKEVKEDSTEMYGATKGQKLKSGAAEKLPQNPKCLAAPQL